MNRLLLLCLSMSFSGAVLIAAMAALRPVYRGRLSRRWQYYIWLAVILRLILPFAPEQNLAARVFAAVGNWSAVESSEGAGPGIADSAAPAETAAAPAAFPGEPNAAPQSLEGSLGPAVDGGKPDHSTSGLMEKAFFYMGGVWLAVAAALFLRKVTMYQSLVRFIKAGRMDVADLWHLEALGQVLEQEKVRGSIALYTNPQVSSPMLMGMIRPFIVMPDLDQTEQEFHYTLLHEVVHYKRADMVYKWLVQLAVCLHWFNPLVYWMGREINRLCELSCDEAVIRRLDEQERTAYGDTLLNAVKSGGFVRDSLACVTLHQDGKLLKERLGAIMEFKMRPRYGAGLAVISAVMVCGGAFAAGAYTGQVQPESQAAPTAAGALHSVKPWQPVKPQDNFSRDGYVGDEAKGFVYTQNGYYEAPYVIELGWNLKDKDWSAYPNKAWVSVGDGQTMTVAFDAHYAEYAEDQGALAALGSLIAKLAGTHAGTNPELERVLVVSIQDTTGRELKELSGEYYQQGQLARFAAVFPWLDSQSRKDYCNRMIEEGKVAFFSAVAGELDQELLNFCVEKVYAEGNISFFAVAMDECGDDMRQSWADRASGDERNNFRIVAQESKDKDQIPTESWAASQPKSYEKDAAGLVNVPVDIDHLNSGESVCVAQVPDIRAARNFTYNVQAASGQGTLYVGIQKAQREEAGTWWFHYIGKGQHVSYDSSGGQRYDPDYSGPYCIYVESKYGNLDNISGSVKITYE